MRIPARTITLEMPIHKGATKDTAPEETSNSSAADNRDAFSLAFNSEHLINELRREELRFEPGKKNFILSAHPFVVDIKPLPPVPAGNINFSYIPVGEVSIASSIDNSNVRLGGSVTLNIRLSGDANLRPLELEKPLNDDNAANFNFFFDKREVVCSEKNGRLQHEKTFRVELLPKKIGIQQIPVFSVLVFNPKSQSYEFLRSSSSYVLVEQAFSNVVADTSAKTLGNSSTAQDPAKQEVIAIGEDLRPQAQVSTIADWKKRFAVSPKARDMAIIFVPIIALITCWSISRNRNAALKNAAPKNRAYREASVKLSKLNLSAEQKPFDKLANIFFNYVSMRLIDSEAGITTTKDIKQVLGKHISDEVLKSSVEKFLDELDALRFGSVPLMDAKPEKCANLRITLSNLLKKCDKHLSKTSTDIK